ncbi:MAG: BON domain-containing protein [Candidatus Rokuibacteriota bacterium]
MRNVEFVAAVALLTGCSLVTGQPAGQVLNDVTMTATVKGRLARSEGLHTLTAVQVRTDDDMVHLTGRVADAATRDRIDALVRNLAGHNRVKNQLTTEGETSQASIR